ncbi:MAG: hypothetical protein AMS17_15775 [Spirochaetes bacterium DG_61]|nr:MAG: hypothetical protein AMS17_15775 [Spirochaetes bacterium DG_61]
MKRCGIILIIILVFTACISLLSADEPADEYVLVKKEFLERMKAWIQESQRYMDELLMENAALQTENGALKAQLESYKKGLFIGGNIGLPLGGDAMVLYQFERSGVYSLAGYNNGWNIHIVYVKKVK